MDRKDLSKLKKNHLNVLELFNIQTESLVKPINKRKKNESEMIDKKIIFINKKEYVINAHLISLQSEELNFLINFEFVDKNDKIEIYIDDVSDEIVQLYLSSMECDQFDKIEKTINKKINRIVQND